MKFDRLIDFAIATVIAAALSGHLPDFTQWVQMQTAKVLMASRASTWGSPLLFEQASTLDR
jgi:hypothetical protein